MSVVGYALRLSVGRFWAMDVGFAERLVLIARFRAMDVGFLMSRADLAVSIIESESCFESGRDVDHSVSS